MVSFRSDVAARYARWALDARHGRAAPGKSSAGYLVARNAHARFERQHLGVGNQVGPRQTVASAQSGQLCATANEAAEINLLEVAVAHLDQVAWLIQHHRDPFDRMIIAQAKVEEIPVVTADRTFTLYDIATIVI